MKVNKKILKRIKSTVSASLAISTLSTSFPHQNVKAGSCISCIEALGYDYEGSSNQRNASDESISRYKDEILRLEEVKNKISGKLGKDNLNAPRDLIDEYTNLRSVHRLTSVEMKKDGEPIYHYGFEYWVKVIRSVPTVINKLREYGNGLGVDVSIFDDMDMSEQFYDEMIEKVRECGEAQEFMLKDAMPRPADDKSYTSLYVETHRSFSQYLEKLISVLIKLENEINKGGDEYKLNFLGTSFLILFDYTPDMCSSRRELYDNLDIMEEIANHEREEKFERELEELRQEREQDGLDEYNKIRIGGKIKRLKREYNQREIRELEQEVHNLSRQPSANAVRIAELKRRIKELEEPSED